MSGTTVKVKLQHISELDGLRGLAVLLVMLYHFVHVPVISENIIDIYFAEFFKIGWLGVDIFFVLSGFLITRILLNTKDEKYYFLDFYYKRTLRIFPLYYLYLIFIFFIFYPLIYSKVTEVEQEKILYTIDSQAWLWFYLSNIKQAIIGKFLGGGVGHLWSLAIEEQFYIVWPFIVFLFSTRSLKFIALLFVFGALLLRVILFFQHTDPLTIYLFTLTRFDSLTIGGLVAILLNTNFHFSIAKLKAIFYALGALIVAMLFLYGPRPDENPEIYILGYTILALFVGILIILILKDETFKLKGFLNIKPLIFLGKYSYAIYLFHPLVRQALLKITGDPIVVLGTQIPWMILFIIAGVSTSIIVALISWNLYEKWFLKLKTRPFFK